MSGQQNETKSSLPLIAEALPFSFQHYVSLSVSTPQGYQNAIRYR